MYIHFISIQSHVTSVLTLTMMIVYPRETFPHTRTARAQPPAAHRRRHSRLHHRRHEKHSPTARQPHSNGLSNAQVARGMPTTSRLAWSGQATPAYTQRAAAIPVYPFRFDSISCHILITPTRRLREVRRPLLGQPGLARPHHHIHNGPRRYLCIHFNSIQSHATSVLTPTRSMLEVRRPLLGQPGLARPHQHIHNGPRRIRAATQRRTAFVLLPRRRHYDEQGGKPVP